MAEIEPSSFIDLDPTPDSLLSHNTDTENEEDALQYDTHNITPHEERGWTLSTTRGERRGTNIHRSVSLVEFSVQARILEK